jgi:hypothetical protein
VGASPGQPSSAKSKGAQARRGVHRRKREVDFRFAINLVIVRVGRDERLRVGESWRW